MRRLLDEFDSHELAEWMAYYRLEPWGEERADIRAAIIARTIAATVSKEPPDLEAFLPFRDSEPQTLEEMKGVIRSIPKGTN